MKHLEPVVKQSNTSFSILLLRNDSKVVRFRLNSFWVKLLVFFFVCFSGASGAAGYGVHYYWKKYTNLQRERSELAEKLGENRRQLNEFASIEKIERQQPRSSMVGVSTLGAENGTPGGAAGGASSAAAASPVAPRDGAALGQAPNSPGAAPSTQTGGTTSTPPTDMVAESGAGPADAPSALSGGEQDHPALIDKVQVRSTGAGAYRLTYELVNRERERESGREQYMTLNGKVVVAVEAKDGTRHEITTLSGDSLRFVIKWGKRVDISFSLPAALPPRDAEKLLLTVEGENFPNITHTFPLPRP